MDVTKWKSVVIPIETYEELKQMAQRDYRTLSGQFTFLIEKEKRGAYAHIEDHTNYEQIN